MKNTKQLFTMAISAILLVFGFNASAAPLFEENWNSGSINTTYWKINNGSQAGTYSVVSVGSGNSALLVQFPGDVNTASSGDWSAWIYNRTSYPRGKNLSCTFTIWTASGTHHQGPAGPWHKSNNGPALHETLAGGISDRTLPPPDASQAELTQKRPGFSSRGWGWQHPDYISFYVVDAGGGQKLIDKWMAATSPAAALTFRVTAGNTNGMKYEFSTNGGQTWQLAGDDRGQGIGGSNANLYLGFGLPVGAFLLDNIIVEDDDNKLVTGATPTATAGPNSIGASWSLFE